jgi:hypothetical protein
VPIKNWKHHKTAQGHYYVHDQDIAKQTVSGTLTLSKEKVHNNNATLTKLAILKLSTNIM